jgi:hypothetical protein
LVHLVPWKGTISVLTSVSSVIEFLQIFGDIEGYLKGIYVVIFMVWYIYCVSGFSYLVHKVL